jgi:hypothetical protein
MKGHPMLLSIRRRAGLVAVLAAALSLTGLSLLPVGAANAAPSCPSGWNCVYANTNYSDGPGLFQGTTHSWTTLSSGGACIPGVTAAKDDTNESWNDCASSMQSNESAFEFFFQNAGCTGWLLGLTAGDKIPNLVDVTTDTGNANDGISANSRNETGGC